MIELKVNLCRFGNTVAIEYEKVLIDGELILPGRSINKDDYLHSGFVFSTQDETNIIASLLIQRVSCPQILNSVRDDGRYTVRLYTSGENKGMTISVANFQDDNHAEEWANGMMRALSEDHKDHGLLIDVSRVDPLSFLSSPNIAQGLVVVD